MLVKQGHNEVNIYIGEYIKREFKVTPNKSPDPVYIFEKATIGDYNPVWYVAEVVESPSTEEFPRPESPGQAAPAASAAASAASAAAASASAAAAASAAASTAPAPAATASAAPKSGAAGDKKNRWIPYDERPDCGCHYPLRCSNCG